MIHVNRGATSLGAFSEEEVREGLRTGRFASSDLGWREGMPSWKPLSQFSEFAAAAPAAPPAQIGATSTSETAAQRSGLPWEHRHERGFANAFIETLAMVLTKPDQAFRTMKTEGGLAEPLIYALIGGCVGGIVSLLLSLGLQSMGLFAGQRDTFAALAGIGRWLDRAYRPCPGIHCDRVVYRSGDCSSLFDDRGWRKQIVRDYLSRRGIFPRLDRSAANHSGLWRTDFRVWALVCKLHRPCSRA